MADINKLKDKIKSTIYPNGKGAINASDHQALLLDMADGMAETDTKLATLSAELVYSNPLSGVVFGSQYDDNILKDFVKSVWIEVLDETLPFDSTLLFAVVRNDDTRSPQVVFQFSKDSGIVFTYTSNTKLSAGTHEIICAGYGDFTNKANLHLILDFSFHTENIAFGSASTDSYIELANIAQKEITSLVSLKDAVVALENATNEQYEQMQSSFEYSNALKGCVFGGLSGDGTLRKSLKSLWLQRIDNTIELPKNLKFSFFSNRTQNGFLLQLVDESGNIVFQQYNPSQKFVGRYIGAANGYSDYNDKVFLHYELELGEEDFHLVSSNLGSQLIVPELNTSYTSTLTNNEALSKLTSFKGKKIVCFGDSITAQTGLDGLRYSDYLQEITSADIINVGVGGTQFRQRVLPVLTPTSVAEGWAGLDIINMVKAAANLPFDNTYSYRDLVNNAANYVHKNNLGRPLPAVNNLMAIDWQGVDAVTIFAGTNDWRNGGANRGESGSNDVNTTLGAINEIIRILLSAYPHIKLYWFTPIVRWGETSQEWTADNWSDTLVINGYTLKGLSELIKAEVVSNHIPVCDMYNTLGWNMYNFSQYFVEEDGTHPKKGYRPIAEKIAAFLSANKTF